MFARQFWVSLLQLVGIADLVPQQTNVSFEGWWRASSLWVHDEQFRKGFNSLIVLGAIELGVSLMGLRRVWLQP
jgi:hypothetical protein